MGSTGTLNSMTMEMSTRLGEEIRQLSSEKSVRMMTVESEVKGVYSWGIDAKQGGVSSQKRKELLHSFFVMCEAIGNSHVPVVSVVDGQALAGGAVLALATDLRIVTAGATVAFSEPKVGIVMPDAVFGLAEVLRKDSLFDLLVLGRQIAGEKQIIDCGFGNRFVEKVGDADAIVKDYLGKIGRLSRDVVADTLLASRRNRFEKVHEFVRLGGQPNLEKYLGDDFMGEGLRSVAEKRAPKWKS